MVTTYSSIADEIKNISWKYASENIDDDLHTDILFMELLRGFHNIYRMIGNSLEIRQTV